jgi:hypothetical protein
VTAEVFAQDGIVRLADLPMHEFEFLCECKAQCLDHAVERVVEFADAVKELIRRRV